MAGKFIDDLVFKVIADTKGAVEGMKKVGDKAQELNRHTKASASGMEAMFGKIKVGAAVAATAIAAVGAGFLKMGLDAATAAGQAEVENRRLALTLKNVTGATDEAASAMVQYVSDISLAYGIAGSQLNPALEALARSTRDVAKSQEILSLAMDVSAGTGFDLQTVSVALGQAYTGNFSQLTRLKTGLSNATLETKNFKTISAELASLFAGQADQSVNTFQGQVNRMRLAFKNLQENLGTMLIPVFRLVVDIINKSLIPAIRNWITNAQKHPEVVEKMVKATANIINVFKNFAGVIAGLGSGLLLFISLLARVVQGFGWLIEKTGGSYGKQMREWGKNTADGFNEAAQGLADFSTALSKWDANKYIKPIDMSKIKLPGLLPDVSGGVSGGSSGDKGEVAKLANDWNDAAKAILEASKTIKSSLTSILNLNFKKIIADLSLDPLVASMNTMIDASADYAKIQNDLVAKTKTSAQADLDYVKSMQDVTEAGKAKTQALKNVVDQARDAAIVSANNANDALQRIAEAQKAFVDETVNRIKSMRDAFRSATQVSLGGIATSISDAKRNISQAKENLADAEKTLLDAQNKFKSNATIQAYEGVILKTSLPIFEAEKAAVEKAKKDLAIALGEEKNPYAATAEELIKALKNAYDNAVALSKTAGDLAALGFSQDFITQIIEAGPDLGNELGQVILSADPKTQESMRTIFNNIQNISKTGVNQLSIDLNAGAVAAMEAFIKGLKTVEDPLDKLMKAIEDRISAMVTSIIAAINALMAQLAALAQIPITGVPNIQIAPGFEDQTILSGALQSALDAENALADAEKILAESELALADQMLWESQHTLMNSGTVNSGSVADWRRGEERSMAGFSVVVNASTNADPYDIASATAFAIKTKSDGTYMYGSGVSNR